MSNGIYMDNHATTPCDPRVVAAMAPYWTERPGNASSSHRAGQVAHAAVEAARRQVAALVDASPKEIVFTSGATEALNLAIKGVYGAAGERDHIVTLATEHSAVLDSCAALERQGARVTYVPVEASGLVAPGRIAEALDERTALVAVMAANNEIGTLQPLAQIAAVCRDAGGIPFLSDAAQAAGKVPLEPGPDLLALSAHKLYGPKGVGCLVVRRRRPAVRLRAQQHGGGHERALRSGTLAVPLIVGFGEACALARAELEAEGLRVAGLRDRLLAGLRAGIEELTVNGTLDRRLPNNLNVSVACVEGEALLMGLDDIAVSSGAACSSRTLESSHVLRAIGVPDALAWSALRFGLGRFTTVAEVDQVATRVVETVARLRSVHPLWQARLATPSPAKRISE